MAAVTKNPLPIIISGTGPAALLFAQALLRASPPMPFRIYERDLSMTHRAQGYRFGVKGRGVTACREILGLEHFSLLRATCGDNSVSALRRLEALTGKELPAPPFKRGKQEANEEPLTADRTVMRQVLFKGLEKYTSFGKEIVGYETTARHHDDSGTDSAYGTEDHTGSHDDVLVRFADGSAERAALLVGADGAYSRIRSHLAPQIQLRDVEMRVVLGKTFLKPDFYEALSKAGVEDPPTSKLLQGVTFVADPAPQDSPMFFMYDMVRFGRRKEAIASDPQLADIMPEDYVYWALALRSDRSEVKDLNWSTMDGSAGTDFAHQLTDNWTPKLRAILQHADRSETSTLRSAIVPLPLVDWRKSTSREDVTSPMVTLIGDAAHVMPPTGGVGAALALTDAAVLSNALLEHGISPRALEVYEAEMRSYAEPSIASSITMGKMLVGMRELEDMKSLER